MAGTQKQISRTANLAPSSLTLLLANVTTFSLVPSSRFCFLCGITPDTYCFCIISSFLLV
uniref:Uncharacterized protein n=1 Tax=Anguilla anguilla TaxID=7936 RepID=A0A0E9WJ21_ANGAN